METRTKLLNAAEALCRNRGFDAFSYAHLADEVGIRKASIHHHFPTKDNLAVAMLDRYRDAFMSKLDALDQEHMTAAARLSGYLDLYRSALSEGDQVCLCVAMSLSCANLSVDAQRSASDFQIQSLRWLVQVFETALSDDSIAMGNDTPNARAYATLALVEGAHVMSQTSGDPTVFEAAVESLRHQLDVI